MIMNYMKANKQKNMNSLNTNTYQDSQALQQQAWHFAMFSDTQIDKLKEGINELGFRFIQ